MSRARAAVLVAAAAFILGACSTPGASGTASGTGGGGGTCVVGVSWNNFQQPRWAATDKPKMQKTIEDGGGKFLDADANLDNQRQLSDVDSLIQRGAKVLVLLAQDSKAILPALQKAKDAGIPVIAYDRLIEDTSGSVLYITFDNVAVGKAEADALFAKVPKGNYVLMKGDPGDANASTFLPQGWDEAGLKDKVASGDIKIVGPKEGQFTPGWDTQKAQNEMEAIIDSANASNTKIDAVLAENDSTALGVSRAFDAKNIQQPPISGQDGDPGNLPNLAIGKQYVDVWKNSNELGKAGGQAALQLCQGKKASEITINVDSSVAPAAGNSPTDFKTPGGNTVKSLILKPTPLLAADLTKIFTAGWYVTKDKICAGVKSSDPGAQACGV
jgi:D-xylose transport system substrate-binding protein